MIKMKTFSPNNLDYVSTYRLTSEIRYLIAENRMVEYLDLIGELNMDLDWREFEL